MSCWPTSGQLIVATWAFVDFVWFHPELSSCAEA
ncbi:putative Secreted protein [Streptomyces viridochromogenes Tue57]|uniref:Putative Secreted protein n=1 Tax=Streptomyces viridochromogenes Tue57 TaxID=1160705 RepID=L8P8J9_STRVR|nr:putative Secreted protein [Streptomyces viridochromogenes Tue57]